MKSLLRFDSGTVSDQKRMVRGEHLLMARTALRARDAKHHANWRVLMLAGGSPEGEVNAIRELMHKAHITAADNDYRCVAAAIDAGVDDVVCCDLGEWSYAPSKEGNPERVSARRANTQLVGRQFDLVDLDLCAGATPDTQCLVAAYSRLVSTHGVFMLTFSYGRDVTEVFNEFARKNADRIKTLVDKGASESVAARIVYLFPTNSLFRRIKSVMVYRGAEMPMVAVFLSMKDDWHTKLSFVKVEPGDMELAVVYPDAANLYDCPRDRIDSLRRKFAAIKAAYTRSKSNLLDE